MRITRNLEHYVAVDHEPIRAALTKINANRSRQVFVVSSAGHLQGVLTDGDFRRWIVTKDQISLDAPVSELMNTSFVSAALGESIPHIESLSSHKIASVPLINDKGRLCAIAWRDGQVMRIGQRDIG